MHRTIAIGSDHAGFELKQHLLEKLRAQLREVKDFGTFSADSVDYPDFAHPVAEAVGNGEFLGDRAGWPSISGAMLRALANFPGHEVTYTCVPRGSGARLAVDRDDDGFLDGDEVDACSDPADPESTP